MILRTILNLVHSDITTAVLLLLYTLLLLLLYLQISMFSPGHIGVISSVLRHVTCGIYCTPILYTAVVQVLLYDRIFLIFFEYLNMQRVCSCSRIGSLCCRRFSWDGFRSLVGL